MDRISGAGALGEREERNRIGSAVLAGKARVPRAFDSGRIARTA
jgi:hypothetical protein